MKILKIVGAWLILLFLFSGLAWTGIAGSRWFIALLKSIDPEVAAAIVTGGVTIIVATAGVFLTKLLESRAAIRQENRAKKIPVYEEIVGFITKLFAGERIPGLKLSEDELAHAHLQLMEKIVCWGSDGVLKAYADVRKASLAGVSVAELAQLLEALFLAIRKDLGHAVELHRRGDILVFFFNDVDQLLGATDKTLPKPGSLTDGS